MKCDIRNSRYNVYIIDYMAVYQCAFYRGLYFCSHCKIELSYLININETTFSKWSIELPNNVSTVQWMNMRNVVPEVSIKVRDK